MTANDRTRHVADLMATYMASGESVDLRIAHPLPWTWAATYYDGAGVQFLDANGKPVLCGLIYEIEAAADLLTTINASK